MCGKLYGKVATTVTTLLQTNVSMNIHEQEFLSSTCNNEDQFTATTFKYIVNNFSLPKEFIFHIPNESATSKLMRLKFHSMGVLGGVPDFCLLLPYLWFLELKMPNGILLPSQKSLHIAWKSKNIIVEVAWNKKEVISICNKHLNQF